VFKFKKKVIERALEAEEDIHVQCPKCRADCNFEVEEDVEPEAEETQ